MPRTLSRRALLRVLASAVPIALLTPGVSAASIVPVTTQRATRTPANVWAAMMEPIADGLRDLPPRVYVPHENGGDIAVIDPETRQIVDRFGVGRTPHHVTPAYDMRSLYVNVMASNRIVQIDPFVGRPARSYPVASPYNLYFTLDGSLAVVAAEPANRLDFYDAASWQLVRRLAIPASGVDHLDFSADGDFLVVTGEFGGQLVKVDLQSLSVAGVLRLGGLPIDVKLAPAGDVFYVANQSRHGVSVVDADAFQEVGFLPTGRGAHGLAISRDTRSLYVSNRLQGTISVVDFASGSVVDTWVTGGSPDMLQVSPDGGEVWASGRSNGVVYVVDTRSGELLDRIRTGNAPHGLTYFPQPGRICLGHNGVYR